MNDIQIIANKINTLPSRPPFMLDSDLATVYGTSTSRINEAVKRNPDRFPDDFVFQLTKSEAESCSYAVAVCDSMKRNKRHLPYAFTREGCNMLSAVLRTPVAVARSIQIMRAFTAMEKGESASMEAVTQMSGMLKELNERIKAMEERPPVNINLPDDSALPIALERKRGRRHQLRGGFKFAEVRRLVIELFRAGETYEEIENTVKERYPAEPERHISRSAAQRFCFAARLGRLKEYGIDVTYH